VLEGLVTRGHSVESVSGRARSSFGLGQIIRKDGDVYWAGSDPRGDGYAAGLP
jgi:gamma-glutamyltranspeptidase